MSSLGLSYFSGFLLNLYRLSQEAPVNQFQDRALNLMKAVLPFDAGVWGTATTTKTGVDIHTLHTHQKSPDMMAEYEALKHQDTAAATLFGRAKATGNFHAASWFPRAEDAQMREYLRRWKQENILLAGTNNARTHFMHWMSLYRADREDHCTEDDRLLLEQLAPHLMQALGMNRVVHLESHGPAQARALPSGAAVADLRGVVYHCDPQFESLMRTEWERWRAHALPSELMKQMLAGGERFVGRAIVVLRRVEHGLLFIQARPRCPADSLSPREYAVAELVAKGLTYKEVAQNLYRAPATVRNQIRAVYEKLEVNNIAGVVDALRAAW